jgi:5'-nucleotidase / UDP-sugar diphosphatase
VQRPATSKCLDRGIPIFKAEGWQIQGQRLQLARNYRVAINDFLMSGKEWNLEFLTSQVPRVKLAREHRDIRLAVIQELQIKAQNNLDKQI